MSSSNDKHYCLSGASLDTGNLGVSALGLSVLTGIAARRPDWTPYVFDYSRKVRRRELELEGGGRLKIVEMGASNSRRLYRTDTLGFMRIAQHLGSRWHSGLRAMSSSVSVLDLSGGDSFTDLYGPRRFSDVTTRKQLALNQGAKLILMPQTYGPFTRERSRRVAKDLIGRSHHAWSRDPDSHAYLRELLGDDYDPDRHHQGVDVAFGLPIQEPRGEALNQVRVCMQRESGPLVGLNVSGLLYNSDKEAAIQYGLRADYRSVIQQLVRRLLDDGAKVVLIPHVVTDVSATNDPGESDSAACLRVFEELRSEADGRLSLLPNLWDPREAKWAIGQLDWFCGTRMHSTIAALSQAVPVVALSYSVKTRGVFETCGAADCVADPRTLSTEETVDAVWDAYLQREQWRQRLQQSVPDVVEQAAKQMEMIVSQMLSD